MRVLLVSFAGIAISALSVSAAPDANTLLRLWEPVLSGTVSALSISLTGTTIIGALDPAKNPMNSSEALCSYLKRGGTFAIGTAAFIGELFWVAAQQSQTSDLAPLLARSTSIVFLGYAGAVAGAQLGASWMCGPSSRFLVTPNSLPILLVVSVAAATVGALGIFLWR